VGIVDRLRERVQNSFSRGGSATVGEPTSPIESLTKAAPYGLQIEVLRMAAARLDKGEGSDIDRMLVDTMGRAGMQNSGQVWKGARPNDRRLESALGENISGYIGINDYGFKGKRQYIADRRYLLDLYVVAYNNADVRTAITHQRNEIFRRGFDWVQGWDYKCPVDDEEFTAIDARKLDYKHKHKIEKNGQEREVAVDLKMPDEGQKVEFDKFIESCNYFGQSLETILRECWDDINVTDDAFIFVSKEYTAEQKLDKDDQPTGEWEITGKPKFIFRLDPVLVEFDLDQRGIPGMRHHICLIHRDELLEVPPGEGWELEWKGQCPTCGLPTYPTIFKYNESYLQGGYGTAQAKVLYLTAEEVIHWSYYTPSELYGYPPILSIYEKALTLIGMDRYIYDYFYERKVPQGIISTVTDDPKGIESVKSELQARMQQDPHYIPWIAVSAKTGAGKTEFVRFAYTLDELNYLPVRDEIRDRIAGIYGVSAIWMSSVQGIGGLNAESQQLQVMSRVVEGAQRIFHEQVFPALMSHFGVTDWELELATPEEDSELAELQIKQSKATLAQTWQAIGFGIEFDQEKDEYTATGSVPSMQEQQQQQMEQQSIMGEQGQQAGGQFPGAGPGGGGGAPAPPPADVGEQMD